MKRPLQFLPPAAALLASGLWLGLQHRSISNTGAAGQALAASIQQARSAASPDPLGRHGVPRRADLSWGEIAGTSRNSIFDGLSGERRNIELQLRLHAMDETELLAQLREIEALDLSEQERLQLQRLVIEVLAEKDPALALEQGEHWLDRAPESHVAWTLGSALAALARQDPAAAEAWLDRQIAMGRLESRSLREGDGTRVNLEFELLRERIGSDPSILARRLESMEQVLLSGVITRLLPLPAGQEKQYASQIRAALPEPGANQILASAAQSPYRQGGFQGVEDYLDATEATAAERVETVRHVTMWRFWSTNGDIAEHYEATRAWAMRVLPEGAMDEVTPTMLQQLSLRDRGQAISYAREHHAEGASDEILLPFIRNIMGVADDTAREMAESLRDPELRQQVLDALDGGG